MHTTVTKLLRLLGRIVLFIVIVAGTLFLVAERLHETPFVNFMRSLL